MAQWAIHSPVDVSLKKSGLANSLHFHGQVDIPVKAIQMVKKTLQLVWTSEVGDVSWPIGQLGITTICCVKSQKSADLIYFTEEA
jgi:hypothetical protein